LDVGCGAGTLALVAAGRGAPGVVAVDRSPRAGDLTRFNAALHDAAIDVRVGDLVEPVRDESFDLVVSQPPYLPLPPGVPPTGYLHGGVFGDEVARRLLAVLPSVLAPGGVGIVRADRAVDAEPFAGIELSWPGPDPTDVAAAYAATHVADEGTERDDVAARYRSHLPRFRSALVVVGAGPTSRPVAVELEAQPASWEALTAAARF
ncbi:MAG: methyltransferase, partial [Acidimicrobiia bacterium]|nr:methyltransferase [Acidimicrobiia bacterium]